MWDRLRRSGVLSVLCLLELTGHLAVPLALMRQLVLVVIELKFLMLALELLFLAVASVVQGANALAERLWAVVVG